jgi:hypothetical protein
VWIIREWRCISPSVIVKGFKKCCLSNVVVGTGDVMLWNSGQEDGVSVRKVKALTVNMEKVTLFGICR